MIIPVHTSTPESRHVYSRYWEAVAAADTLFALRSIEQGLVLGESPERLIREVIAPIQEEVGRAWELGTWSIADEHVATAIAEQAMALLRCPRRHRNPSARHIVLACPEGEWHTFPARIAGALAEHAGIHVTFVGGSCPAEHLAALLSEVQPDALALSVTLTTRLVGAWKMIRASHLVGVPVIVGGAAWGAGSHRAERLGADLRVDDPADLVRAVNLVTSGRPLKAPVLLPAEIEHLSASRDRRGHLTSTEDLLLDAATAAAACGDFSILTETRTWLMRAPASGGVSSETLTVTSDKLAERLLEDAPLIAESLSSLSEGLRHDRLCG